MDKTLMDECIGSLTYEVEPKTQFAKDYQKICFNSKDLGSMGIKKFCDEYKISGDKTLEILMKQIITPGPIDQIEPESIAKDEKCDISIVNDAIALKVAFDDYGTYAMYAANPVHGHLWHSCGFQLYSYDISKIDSKKQQFYDECGFERTSTSYLVCNECAHIKKGVEFKGPHSYYLCKIGNQMITIIDQKTLDAIYRIKLSKQR